MSVDYRPSVWGSAKQFLADSLGKDGRGTKVVAREPSAEEAKYQKRRKQVREAQRKYRNKQEHYVLALEARFVELQANFATVEKRAACMEAEIERLRTSPYADPSWSAPQKDLIAWTQVLNTSQGSQRLSVEFDSLVSPEPSPQDLPVEDLSSLAKGSSLNELELTQLGINFVLFLERPCLEHITSTSSKYYEPCNHSFQLQYHLLARRDNNGAQNSTLCWPVPQTELNNLLALSPDLTPWEEITPIQMWQQITSYPGFEACDAARVRELGLQLSRSTRCYGFGAVASQRAFAKALISLLG